MFIEQIVSPPEPRRQDDDRTSANARRSGKAAAEGIQWEWLARRALHDVKVAIIEALYVAGQPMTATELWRSFDTPRSSKWVVIDHLKRLAAMGAVIEVESVPIGRATERYFELAPQVRGEAGE